MYWLNEIVHSCNEPGCTLSKCYLCMNIFAVTPIRVVRPEVALGDDMEHKKGYTVVRAEQ